MPRKSGFAGCISATQNIVDAFFMKNGLSIDELGSGYVEEGFSTEDTYYPTKYTYGSADKKEGLVTPKVHIICTLIENPVFMPTFVFMANIVRSMMTRGNTTF